MNLNVHFKKESYSISEYARLLGISRRTVYNWIERGSHGLEIIEVGCSRHIKKPPNPFPHENIHDMSSLSVEALAGLCTMYKLNKSEESRLRVEIISKELDRRLTNIFA